MKIEEKTREQLILEYQHVKQSLRKLEQEFSSIISNIPAMVFKGYDDWSIEFYSDKVEEITGYSMAEFGSRRLKWSQVLVEEDIERAKKVFIQALKSDRSYVREYRIRRKDGEIVWIEERSHIVCDSKGKMEYVDGLFFDITDRVLTEESSSKYRDTLQEMLLERTYELKKANERLRQAGLDSPQTEEAWKKSIQPLILFFATDSVGFAIWDPELRYVSLNSALAKMNGLPVEQHVGRTVDEIQPKTVPLGRPLLQQVIETRKPVLNMEVRGQVQDESGTSARFLTASFFPLIGTDGELAGVGSVVIDVVPPNGVTKKREKVNGCQDHQSVS